MARGDEGEESLKQPHAKKRWGPASGRAPPQGERQGSLGTRAPFGTDAKPEGATWVGKNARPCAGGDKRLRASGRALPAPPPAGLAGRDIPSRAPCPAGRGGLGGGPGMGPKQLPGAQTLVHRHWAQALGIKHMHWAHSFFFRFAFICTLFLQNLDTFIVSIYWCFFCIIVHQHTLPTPSIHWSFSFSLLSSGIINHACTVIHKITSGRAIHQRHLLL